MSSWSAIRAETVSPVVVAAEDEAAAREGLVAALDGKEPVERLQDPFVVDVDDVAVADLDDVKGLRPMRRAGAMVCQSPL